MASRFLPHQRDDLDDVVIEHKCNEVSSLAEEDRVWRVFSFVHHFSNLSARDNFNVVVSQVMAEQCDIEALCDHEQVVGCLFFLIRHLCIVHLCGIRIDHHLFDVDVPTTCARCSWIRLLRALLLGRCLLYWTLLELLGRNSDHVKYLVVELGGEAEVDGGFFDGVHFQNIRAESH